jgi:hypothetical protein
LQPLGDGEITVLGHVNLEEGSGIRVHRAANGGYGVQNYLQRDASFDELLRLIDPDLVMIWLRTNDQRHTVEQYALLVAELLDRVQDDVPDTELIVFASYDSDGPNIQRIGQVWADAARQRGRLHRHVRARGFVPRPVLRGGT